MVQLTEVEISRGKGLGEQINSYLGLLKVLGVTKYQLKMFSMQLKIKKLEKEWLGLKVKSWLYTVVTAKTMRVIAFSKGEYKGIVKKR